jgi:bifunctional enzyme CysN/CysC
MTPSPASARGLVSVVTVGHVDHGKSTLVGRLLADTDNLPEGRLEALKESCARNSKPLEYAYLLDALKDEQAQGITIDAARCFFKTPERDYIIIDAPGHIEFLKNMVSGAARADAALLVIDAFEGIRENSRRHGYFLSMLGIAQLAVVINKMDIVGDSESVFSRLVAEYSQFLEGVRLSPMAFIPADSPHGENIAGRSSRMPWYQGPTVLDVMKEFKSMPPPADGPLRMPVQDVYKFTAFGDQRRIIAGRIESGRLRVGDTVVFWPANKRAVICSIEGPAAQEAVAGQSIGVTLDEQIYVARGDLMTREREPSPQVTSRFRADVFWLGSEPLTPDRAFLFKGGTFECPVQVERVERVLDAVTLQVQEGRSEVRRHEVGECVFRTRKSVAFDVYTDWAVTGRFVLVDGYRIAGGGIIRQVLEDEEAVLRAEAWVRDRKWIRTAIPMTARAQRFQQQPALIVITGARGVGRKMLARTLEKSLFESGRLVYYLGMGSIVHGLDVDLSRRDLRPDEASREHVRRLGEVLHILLDAGMIVISTALELTARDLKDVETLIAPYRMFSIRIGPGGENETDMTLPAPFDAARDVQSVLSRLGEVGLIPSTA